MTAKSFVAAAPGQQDDRASKCDSPEYRCRLTVWRARNEPGFPWEASPEALSSFRIPYGEHLTLNKSGCLWITFESCKDPLASHYGDYSINRRNRIARSTLWFSPGSNATGTDLSIM